MTHKGYLKTSTHAGELARAIAGMEAFGVSPDDILIGENVLTALESMEAGDVLVLHSLGCCAGVRGAAELLEAAAGRGVTVRALEEGLDTSVPPVDWASTAELFRRLEWSYRSERARAALRGSKTVGGRGAGRPKPERLKQGLCKALAEYYMTGRSVRKICRELELDPSVLYRCIKQNGLPRLSEIADDPSRHPFAGGKPLRVRMGDEWMTVFPPESGKRQKRKSRNDTTNPDYMKTTIKEKGTV